MIYRCRFLAILGVFGSLVGSILCFIKVSISNFNYKLIKFTKIIVLVNGMIVRMVQTRKPREDYMILVLCAFNSVLLWFGGGTILNQCLVVETSPYEIAFKLKLSRIPNSNKARKSTIFK